MKIKKSVTFSLSAVVYSHFRAILNGENRQTLGCKVDQIVDFIPDDTEEMRD